MTSNDHPNDKLFWNLAEEHLAGRGAERGTMMGSPCLRTNGDFYATVHRKTKQLIVKLPEARALALIEGGTGTEFKPAGRVFREWLAVSDVDRLTWGNLMEEARVFVAGE